MPLKSTISRRDFMSGVALTGLAFGLAPAEAIAQGLLIEKKEWQYPPSKTGMRGSHAGSFETAHAISWEGQVFDTPDEAVDKPYDLIVVGGGISGLSAAFMARQKLGENARILILDNHDDFGGHAKRNEFTVNGKQLIGYGGSQSIDTPSGYSDAATQLLKDIGINTDAFYRHYDQSFFNRNNMGMGLHFTAEKYGKDTLLRRDHDSFFANWDDAQTSELDALIDQFPLGEEDKALLKKLFVGRFDWLEGYSHDEKIKILKTTSYLDCLKKYAGMTEAALYPFHERPKGLWGAGWDVLSGMEAIRLGDPGIYGLGIKDEEGGAYDDTLDEPYIFHFPDGNAGIARLLVAHMIPDSIAARDMDSIVKAHVHYDRLDKAENSVRIRLNSTVIDTHNVTDGVEVTYVRGGETEKVVAKKAIMACYHHILPHILPEMDTRQVEAISYAEKVPLVYINVAITNWRAFKKAGVKGYFSPGHLIGMTTMDYPVSMGEYFYTENPDEPTVLHLTHIPAVSGKGLSMKEQFREGKHILYNLTFEDYEKAVIENLEGALGPYGFNAETDIAAITVNRWPHGYSYEYNELEDGEYTEEDGPHIIARQSIGNIAIANSDASALAYVNGAIDAADRAVRKLYA